MDADNAKYAKMLVEGLELLDKMAEKNKGNLDRAFGEEGLIHLAQGLRYAAKRVWPEL